ncbi:MAG: hypothetical protein WCO86_17010, partial [Planctomycetota bacterium]
MQTGGLCSHILLMRHLDGDLDLNSLTVAIEEPRRRGRPAKATAALQRQPDERIPPSAYIGAHIAKYYTDHGPAPFIGRVADLKRPSVISSSEHTLFVIAFEAQQNCESSKDEILFA